MDFGDEDEEYTDHNRRESMDDQNLQPNDLEHLENDQFEHHYIA